VLIGRPAVGPSAIAGAAGVRDVFEHLRGELVRTMALCGVAKLEEVTRDLVV
jgi:isopentenyl diphosphate isomerase/L-lactate dehydrogenase-like FMN-dependent dehydrogenase